jgi:hypothetical protein
MPGNGNDIQSLLHKLFCQCCSGESRSTGDKHTGSSWDIAGYILHFFALLIHSNVVLMTIKSMKSERVSADETNWIPKSAAAVVVILAALHGAALASQHDWHYKPPAAEVSV